jgi:hypothetical protein
MNNWNQGYSVINTNSDNKWAGAYSQIGRIETPHWSGKYSSIGKTEPSNMGKTKERKNKKQENKD